MDPYLEPHWLDVHATLIAEAKRVLNRSLPSGLVAHIEEHEAVDSEVDQLVRFGSGCSGLQTNRRSVDWGGAGGGAIAVDAP